MHPTFRRLLFRPLLSALLAAAAVAVCVRAEAGPIRLVSADERGVTLTLETVGERAVPSSVPGRSNLHLPGFAIAGIPGRPEVPYAQTLVAVPPGARALVRVLEESPAEVRTDLLLPIAARPGVGPDAEGLGSVPFEEDVPPILDGAWPPEHAELGTPFVLRRQRMASVSIRPVRYDEATGQLSIVRRITVRVEFVGGARAAAAPAAEDRFWEPVLQGALINYEQGRRLRVPHGTVRGAASPGAGSPGSLLDRPLPGEAAFEPGPARAARPSAALAFEEDAPEVRVHIDTTGFYAFPFAELSAKGFPAGVPVAEVSLHRHEFLAGVLPPAPPYATIEIPIVVSDANSDGMFNGSDAIHAYVRTWAERSGASIHQRNWGDAEVVYATRKPAGAGLRMAVRTGWRGQTLSPLASYPQTRLWERNFRYMTAYFIPADTAHVDPFHWTNLATYYNRPDTISFAINDIDTTQTATVRVNWVGRESPPHYMWARVTANFGQPASRVTWVADSSNAVWTGRQPFTRTATIPGGALSEGATNRFGTWGRRNGSPDPVNNGITFTGLNWFEITWWRRFAAIRGYLECSGAGGSGEIEIASTGYTDSSRLRAYDVSDPDNPVRLAAVIKEPNGGGWRLRMQDSTAAGVPRRYVVTDAPKTLPSAKYSSVTRRRLFDRAAGDYLIVVPEAFMSAVTPLEQMRAGQGMNVVVSPMESIYDEFNGGRHSSWALRNYLRHAYENWSARFVVLVGDGTEDPHNYTGTARPDWIPAHPIGGPVPFSTGSESAFERIPSDQWYGWCLSCDPADFQFQPKIPELFIGRLPVNSAGEAATTIAKVTGYENFAADQLWRRKMLLLADDQYSGQSTFGGGSVASSYCKRGYEDRFLGLNRTIRDVILLEAGMVESEPEIFDMGFWLRNEPIDPLSLPDSCRPDRPSTQVRTRAAVTPELLARLNEGRLWWNYQGHSNEQEVSHEDIYRNLTGDDDKSKFTNNGKLFLFSGFSCHPNSFARSYEAGPFGAAFGEELVTLPDRGAIATFGSTGYEIIPRNGIDHLNVELARSLFVDPPRDAYLGEGGARPVIGEVAVLSFLRWYPRSLSSPFEQGVGMSYTLLGDPATRIWAGPPQAAVTANDVPAVDGAPIRLHTPGSAVSVKAKLVSNASLASITLVREDSAGVDTLPLSRWTITPTFPDTGSASHGGRAYEARLDTALTPETFSYKFRTVDRYGIARTFDAAFAFTTLLRADGQTVNDGDPVSPGAVLTLFVQSPSPVVPATDLTLTINGVPVVFTATADPGDASGREWLLSWSHEPYPIDQYVVELSASGGATNAHLFRVEIGGGELRIQNAYVFPNPFQDDAIGANFSFTLVSGAPADVLLRVYTISGKMIHERKERDLSPGYHQLHWDGLDAEGVPLANGTYVYRLLANNGSSREMIESRLVKLRRPRRGTLESETTP